MKECQARLETLCCLFGLPVPILTFHHNRRGGWYRYKHVYRRSRETGFRKLTGTKQRRIFIGGKSRIGDRGWKAVLLHEFAHYLCHSRAGFRPGRDGNHGPAFRRALTDVATEWYGDPALYPWAHEYKSLAKLGPCQPEDC